MKSEKFKCKKVVLLRNNLSQQNFSSKTYPPPPSKKKSKRLPNVHIKFVKCYSLHKKVCTFTTNIKYCIGAPCF